MKMKKFIMVALFVLAALAIFFSSVSPSDLEKLFLYLADFFAMDKTPDFEG